jgi:carbamoyltransferase
MRKLVHLLPNGSFKLDLRYFRHHRSQISYQWNDGAPQFGDLFAPVLEELLGPRRNPTDTLEAGIATSPAQRRRCTRRRSSI